MDLQNSHLHQRDESSRRINRYVGNGGPSFFDANALDGIAQRLRYVPLVETLLFIPFRTTHQGQRPSFDVRIIQSATCS